MFKDKERYREYLRNYYHAHKHLKYDKVMKSMKLLSDEAIKTNNKKIIEAIKMVCDELSKVIPPRYNFEVPKEILDFNPDDYKFKFKVEEKDLK